jgi:hypothetical protein
MSKDDDFVVPLMVVLSSVRLACNVKALAMWPEFMASSARLPMPGKAIMFQVKLNAQLIFVRRNRSPIVVRRQMATLQAGHIANAHVACSSLSFD